MSEDFAVETCAGDKTSRGPNLKRVELRNEILWRTREMKPLPLCGARPCAQAFFGMAQVDMPSTL